ncbi:response regulator [Reichenbachiella sp. MALMAid0571]|uniref:response regulator n=1 Tax=Reichenbachiella sp. MALMAid0571 TaxID=3143939 RepID=UPI0032DF9335
MTTPPSILFIDDDMIERMKFNRTVTSLGFENKIIEATNGEEALKILESKDSLPDIILLDLNMPRISGKEFLKILKSNETLKFIPTIVLTTSSNHKDLLECYKIGIAGYVLKPLKYEDYMKKISKVISYWNTNELIIL